MSRRITLALIGAAMAVLAAPRDGRACSCVLSSACRQFANAGAVLAGEAIEVVDGARAKTVRLRVLRAYKGVAKAGDVVRVSMPPGPSGSCSLDISRGDRYVIYAEVSAAGPKTSLCHGSHALRPGDPLPDLPPPGGQVTGHLVRHAIDVPRETPIAGAPVWIVTPGGRIESHTDTEGRFTLSGVPSGRHLVRFDVGPAERAEREIELLSADDCAEFYVSPAPAGAPIGAVLDRPGHAPARSVTMIQR